LRAEYPISLVTVFTVANDLSTDLDGTVAGVRSSMVLELFKKADHAERALETTIRSAVRDQVAERYRKTRYPCPTANGFAVFDGSCGDEHLNSLLDTVLLGTQDQVNEVLESYPDAYLSPVQLKVVRDLDNIDFVARSVSPAVFFLDEVDWDYLEVAGAETTFNRSLGPSHSDILTGRANVDESDPEERARVIAAAHKKCAWDMESLEFRLQSFPLNLLAARSRLLTHQNTNLRLKVVFSIFLTRYMMIFAKQESI